MPGSATLESLNIEINASSQKASGGIDGLISSLRSLAGEVARTVPGLAALNNELKSIAKQNYGSLGKILNPETTGLKKATKELTAIQKQINSITGVDRGKPKSAKSSLDVFLKHGLDERLAEAKKANFPKRVYEFPDNSFPSEEERKKANPQWYRSVEESRALAMEHLRTHGGVASWAKEAEMATYSFNKMGEAIKHIPAEIKAAKDKSVLNEYLRDIKKSSEEEYRNLKNSADVITQSEEPIKEKAKGLKAIATGERSVGDEAEEAAPKTNRFFKTLSDIGRMAKSLLIRTALRSLMKSFSEVWKRAYNFSKGMNGEFARSIDAARGALTSISFSCIQAFAPALQAIIPIVNVVAGAIQYLCSVIQWLFSLLGMTSGLLGATANDITNATTGGGGGGKKNLLASWDELNVIQSGGGGGGSGPDLGSITDMINSELSAITSVLVGEALMALGLIMCATGHWGIGLGLIAVGAASIAQVLTVQWGSLSEHVQAEIAQIMGWVGTAFLAIGLILAFTGHVGLGIGLIAMGVANIAGITAATWSDETSSQVKAALTEIMGIAATCMLAIGLLLVFSTVNVPLGIAMIVSGLGVGAAAVGINWNSIVTTITVALNFISEYFRQKWDAIKTKATEVWEVVSKWWTENISDPVAAAWDGTMNFFATLFGDSATDGSIAHLAVDAWESVSVWWTDNIAEPVKGIWEGVKTFFSNLFGDASTDGSIAKGASEALDAVIAFWTDDIVSPIKETWDHLTEFFENLFGSSEQGGSIVAIASDAWNAVSQWWTENISAPLGEVWGGVVEYFKGVWGNGSDGTGIAGIASSAWTSVSQWWGDNIAAPFEKAWGAVTEFFSGLFGSTEEGGSIVAIANDAWSAISVWWGDISTSFSDAWGSVTDFFSGLFGSTEESGSIAAIANDAWTSVSVWWGSVYDDISGAWDSVVTYFEGIIGTSSETGITGLFSGLMATVSELWTGIIGAVESAWSTISGWFQENVTDPIAGAFKDAMNVIIGFLNGAINALNSVGNFTIPGWEITMPPWLGGGTFGWKSQEISLFSIGNIPEFAMGGYDIPRGDLFIANEAGAELVGNMEGKTTVANQGQIIEGIQKGVASANAEQNALLRRQNEILLSLLQKDNVIEFNPSIEWAKLNEQSNNMLKKAKGLI